MRRVHGAARRRPVDSCLVPVCQVEAPTVARSRASPARPTPTAAVLDDLQAAFLSAGGAQCGICTPGMLMAARAYLDAGGGPDEDAIREAIAGNLCRCTGYTKIVEAIALAAGGAEARPGAAGREPRPADAAAALTMPVEPPVTSPRDLAEAYASLADGTRPADRRRHGPDGRPDRRDRRAARPDRSTCGGSTSCAASRSTATRSSSAR